MSAFVASGFEDTLPPEAMLMQVALSHFTARCVHTIAALGVADHVGEAPRPVAAIAADAGVNADALQRILRLLAMHGLFRFEPDGWVHTSASDLLRSNHPTSMRAFAAMIGDDLNWSALADLERGLKSGEAPAARLHPGGVWGYYADRPDLARQFDAAMTGKSHGDLALLLQVLDLTGVKTIADIGGGRGHFLKAILDANPDLNGILFDQADVIAAASDYPRLKKVGGDFFKGGLPVADLYLMTHIIHDWADAESVAILKSVRAAAPKHARLVVFELALPEGPEPHAAKSLDVVMMTITGGRERTAKEYAALFEASGWTSQGQIATQGPMALHVATPA